MLMKEVKCYVAGYYLIQGSGKQYWMDRNNLLPAKIWSGSRHICQKFPDSWILGWSSNRGELEDKREQENARAITKLSVDEFSLAQKEFNEMLQANQFGFPNVFMEPDVALEKYHRYFAAISDLKLLCLGLPETCLEQFFTYYNTQGFKPFTLNVVYLKLSQREDCPVNSVIGCDLLGFDGADYCSFLCGSMESKIYEKYGVRYNQYGLIDEFNKAEEVAQAIINGVEKAEEGFWAPWLVYEVKI
jgi:hypothetical protein